MPDPNEAREEAWRDYLRTYESLKTLQGALDFGWDARGRYDEQRIAELVVALEDDGNPEWQVAYVIAERALGQSEEVER